MKPYVDVSPLSPVCSKLYCILPEAIANTILLVLPLARAGTWVVADAPPGMGKPKRCESSVECVQIVNNEKVEFAPGAALAGWAAQRQVPCRTVRYPVYDITSGERNKPVRPRPY